MRADGISHPLTESECSESTTPHHPPPHWGRGVTALRRASMSIYIYISYVHGFFKHATCMSLSGTGSSNDCSLICLAYNSTYGLGYMQA